MTIADVSLAGQVVLASEFIRRTRWGRMRERIVGAERMKGTVRIALRNMEDNFRPGGIDIETIAWQCRHDVKAAYSAKVGIAWWIPLLVQIIYAAIEWWLEHRKPL